MIVHSYVSSCTPILDDPLNTLAVLRPAEFVFAREAAVDAVMAWRRVVAQHAAEAAAGGVAVSVVADRRGTSGAEEDLCLLRATARAQKVCLDAAFAAAQGLIERPLAADLAHRRPVKRSLRCGEAKKTV